MAVPLCCFFISGEEKQVFPGNRLWELPLSGENSGISLELVPEQTSADSGITIGDYFSAVDQFLSKNDFLVLKTGLEVLCKRPVSTHQIDRISAFLEKHGAFYHPVRIQVTLDETAVCSFVLNGAVSRPGLSLIENEYSLISSLNTKCLKRYLPVVFGIEVIKTDKGRVGFFLGEWFEDFKEFHITENQGKKQIAIWASDGSRCCISETGAAPIYREISRILTHYYDINTFEQIFPWHHAAGDFVVKHVAGVIHVRLVTVRGYAQLIGFGDMDSEKKVFVLPSLMFFCLNLTVRMRMDRLDGTGPQVLLDEKIIDPIVQGFLEGLDEKSKVPGFEDLRVVFISFLKNFSLDQVREMMNHIVDAYPSEPLEIFLIKESMEPHCTRLYSIFKNL